MGEAGVRAGILVTGTEVLSGFITDRNGPWVSERLGELGVEVSQIALVGDRPEDLEAALGAMRDQGMDLIVTTGGLGPTADDLTAEVVGRFAGRELVLDEEMEAKIHAILKEFARRFSFDADALRAANRKQAMVPEGATAIDPAGTAPGLVVPAGEAGGDRAAGPAARASPHVAQRHRGPRSQEGAGPRRAVRELLDPDVRSARVRAGQGPTGDRGGAPTWARWRSPPACAAAS